MIQFILKRILSGFFILFSVITVVFFLFKFSFPNPEKMAVGQRTDLATQESIKKEFGLDKSAFTQYLLFLNDISPISIHPTNDELDNKYNPLIKTPIYGYALLVKSPFLRKSFQSRIKTTTLIKESFKGTFILALASILFAVLFGVLLGVFSAIKVNSNLDQIIVFVSTLGISVPSFFSAIILAWLFGFLLHDYTGLYMTGSWTDIDPFVGEYYQWKNLILPRISVRYF